MKTANRDKVDLYSDTGTEFTCRQGDSTLHANPTWSAPDMSEYYTTASEEYTPNSEGSHKEWKNFEHYKAFRAPTNGSSSSDRVIIRAWEFAPHLYESTIHGTRLGVTGFTSGGSQVRPFGEPGLPITGLPGFHVRRSDGGFVPEPDGLDTLNQRALKTLLPAIKADLSLVNSLYELKDLKSLKPFVLGLRNTISNVTSRYARRRQSDSLRRMTRTSADGYLQAQFNLLPMLSDIMAVQAILSNVERRINDLVNRSGRVQRRHFAFNWSEFGDTPEELSDGHLIYAPGIHIPAGFIQYTAHFLSRRTVHASSQFHAQIEYNYNYTRYQTEKAQLLGLLDALGVNLNPAIIWNAIPWSFVVDWVVGVGRFLDNFKLENMEPKINIRRYLWSIKRQRDIYTEKIASTLIDTVSYGTTKTSLPVVRETAYRRSVGLPNTSSIESSGLSSHEFTLGAALVLSRKRRPTNRRR